MQNPNTCPHLITPFSYCDEMLTYNREELYEDIANNGCSRFPLQYVPETCYNKGDRIIRCFQNYPYS